MALATVILGAIALTAFGQQTIRVTGRVVADDTGNPIPNARVAVAIAGPAASPPPVVMTDRNGQFSFAIPAAARASVTASKSGYGHGDSEVVTRDTTLELRLPRGAVIAGRITDRYGEPAPAVRVAVERAPASVRPTIVARSETDDRGDYRIGSLPAGPFVVVISTIGEMQQRVIGTEQIAMFPSVHEIFYPDSEAPTDAETLIVQAGQERTTVDFVLPAGQSGDTLRIIGSPRPERDAAAPTPGGAIRGRVVSTDGRPVPHAEVRTIAGMSVAPSPGVSGSRALPWPVVATADDDGRYELQALPAGSFRITATKPGYSMPGTSAFSITPADAGPAVVLSDGETRERVDVTMARWGSLGGRVLDELGEPLQGVSVQLMQIRYQSGRRRLIPAGGAARLTDDLGRYRMYGFPPGQYVVGAAVGDVQSADLPGYSRSYYPGTSDASGAQFVSVGLSQEITGIDFSLARTRTALVSGTLLNAAGAPTTQGRVRLVTSQRTASATSAPIGARLESDGRFSFANVPPGQYVIHVDRGRHGSSVEGEFGALPVAVSGTDVTGLTIQTSAGSSIKGHVSFDRFIGALLPRPGAIEIVPVVIDADQSTSSPASAAIQSDWSFEVSGVSGPRRLQVVRTPAEWALREIRVRGIDATDRPIAFGLSGQSLTDVEIVLTDRINELSGTIADDHAKPAPGAHLIVFPLDRDRWYPSSRFLRHAAAGADGAVALAGLPPGSYYAAAVAKLPADGDDAWQDPAFLESLATRATTLALGEGQKRILTLKLP